MNNNTLTKAQRRNINSMGYLSIETNNIMAIFSKDELISMFKIAEGSDRVLDKYDLSNTALITISDPISNNMDEERKPVEDEYCNNFSSFLKIGFWDRTSISDDGLHDIISIEEVKNIANFIKDNKEKNFIINCNAGISRSAGVGLLVEYICGDFEDLYHFKTSFDDVISKHFRYAPNLIVLDQYIKSLED